MPTFHKSEKLCGKKRIQALYDGGKRFTVWPLRVTWNILPDAGGVGGTQVLVWAPKALFRHAVDRNRLRRQMREAYRLNKHLLIALSDPDNETVCHIAFNYMDRQQQPYALINRAVCKALNRINGQLTNENTVNG